MSSGELETPSSSPAGFCNIWTRKYHLMHSRNSLDCFSIQSDVLLFQQTSSCSTFSSQVEEFFLLKYCTPWKGPCWRSLLKTAAHGKDLCWRRCGGLSFMGGTPCWGRGRVWQVLPLKRKEQQSQCNCDPHSPAPCTVGRKKVTNSGMKLSLGRKEAWWKVSI